MNVMAAARTATRIVVAPTSRNSSRCGIGSSSSTSSQQQQQQLPSWLLRNQHRHHHHRLAPNNKNNSHTITNNNTSVRFLSFRRGRRRSPKNKGENPASEQATTTTTGPLKKNDQSFALKGEAAGGGGGASIILNKTRLTTADQSMEHVFKDFLLNWVVPVRSFRFPPDHGSTTTATTQGGRHYYYSRAQGVLLLGYRIPLFVALAALLSWDETAPVSLIRIRGPSMLPTMAADGSDVWLCSTLVWRKRLTRLFSSFLAFDAAEPTNCYKRGDLVGFSPPAQQHNPSSSASAALPSPQHFVSCKRIVGLPGDRVQRYGQYVHLYTEQDPVHWGMTWPSENDAAHAWIDRSCSSWDDTKNDAAGGKEGRAPGHDASENPRRTIVVPPGHVWVEADCPALGIDSRQFGPIPVEWLQGKMVAKVWPFWRPQQKQHNDPKSGMGSWDRRPHPIPLDSETLMEHNVYRMEVQED